MGLKEKVEDFRKNHKTIVGLGGVVVSLTMGLGLSYQISKYDVVGHLGAWSSHTPYPQHVIEIQDRLTKNFMKKYDLNQDGAVTREEYRQVMKNNYRKLKD